MINSYVYEEFGSKNNQGGFASLNQKNKVVTQHEAPTMQCHVKILDKALPPQSDDVFYLKPLNHPSLVSHGSLMSRSAQIN